LKKLFTIKKLIVVLISGVLIGEMALVSSVTASRTPTRVPMGRTTPPTCLIGDTGPGGGIVFYVSARAINAVRGVSAGGRCLEAAPVMWSSPADNPGVKWGCFGTFISTGSGIGTGASNTKKIMAGCSTQGIPARRAGNLSFGGKTDWFLPSKAELKLMYSNLFSAGLGGFTTHTDSEGSVTGYYWSSSAYNAHNAWAHEFGSYGNAFPTSKGAMEIGYSSEFYVYFVRPVRAFG